MKSLENQLKDTNDELHKVKLKQSLGESRLPPLAQTRLRKRFELAESLGELPAAIAEEHEYLRKLGYKPGAAARSDQQQESNSKPGRALVEGYKAFGLNDKEASLAAGVEEAVKGLKESQSKLYGAAKALGLNDAEAEAFSTPRSR